MSQQTEERKKISWHSLKGVWRVLIYIKPYRLYFIGALILLVLGSIFMMAIMGVPGEMVNVAIGQGSKFDFSLKQWGLIMLVLLALRAVMSFVQTILFAHVSEKGMADVRQNLYDRLITQSMEYYEEHRVGELTSRITADVEKLQSIFSITLAEFIRQLMIFILGITILAWLMPKLFVVMLMIIPLVVVMSMVFGRRIRKLSRKRQDYLATTNTIVEETLQNFSIVKAFANEAYESVRFAGSIKEMVKISLRYAWIRGLFFAFIIFLLFGSILFILWQGAFMVQQGEMEAGSLLSFVIYTVMIGGAIASLGSLYTTLAGALGATERIIEIMDSDVEVLVNSDYSSLSLLGNITFEDVSFSYPSRTDNIILERVNINIPSGRKIALVGQSGSGKSTLVKLMMKFYNPTSGRITIDGKDINQYDLIALRKSIGVVPQDVILFGGTIRENLLYGKPEANEEEIREAVEKAHCSEFIDQFADGLETVVGERGIKLSGGQKQRVAIARTILKDPRILILDEATSSLDAESERVVQEAMDNLMVGRTAIVIAHRLATIKNVDKIYVIEQGSIVEEGSHQELIEKRDGVYQNLAKLQFDIHV